METLLYFHPHHSSFIESDFRILEKKYLIKRFWFNVKGKWRIPFNFIYQLWFLLRHMRSCTIMISQFSGYHTFLPSLLGKIFNRPHAIILHGTECNNFPEYGYGFRQRPILFWFSKKSLELATHLLPVSEALVSQNYTYKDTTYKQQGFRVFYKQLATPYTVIYNGVPVENEDDTSAPPRVPNSFISVAKGINEYKRRMIKGLDLVTEAASLFPNCSFTFVGLEEKVNLDLPSNVRVMGYLSQDQLQELYKQHHYYFQLSVSEGFGISVVEAMMSGCIPIVSNVGIMPKIIGPFGYVLMKKDIHLLKQLVQSIIDTPNPINTQKARTWAIDHFPMQKREDSLLLRLSTLKAKKN